MTLSEACDIVDDISVLKFFPSNPAAKGALANKLIEWCRGDIRQARWLVDKGIEGMDEYPGPATLQRIIAEKFRPSGPLATTAPLERSLPDCALCGDLGTRYDEAARTNVWCACEQATRVHLETPDWLTTVNRLRGSKQREEDRDKRVREALQQLQDGYGDRQVTI